MNDTPFQWNADLYQNSSSFQFSLGLEAIDKLRPLDREKLLDIGCGNGLLTIELAKRTAHGHVTGIESSREMFAKAEENKLRSGLTNLRFIKMNALDIGFENEFDAVFSNSAIHWIRDLRTMYGLLCRSLKPGGRIMIQTGLKEINKMVETIIAVFDNERYRPHLSGMMIPWRFHTSDENVELLKSAGFADVAVESCPRSCRFSSAAELSDYLESAPMIPFLSRIPDEEKPGFKQMFVQTYLQKNGHTLEVATTRAFISARKPARL